ncbi:MAG: alpha-L-glutamate ligase, partial [Methylococcales bacterium]|jgi:glutathione synthase/RimK-type ligase-like ATP-grasp enzyme|nr:alpha-L-glutamate ligase [Methylococcales bacterium]
MAALALRATEALAMDYAGVDIIVDKEGHYSVIEVNSIPAWKGLQSICYIDIAQLLVADLLQRHLFHHTNTPKSVALK